MKFALGQINPTLGDFAGNFALIASALAQPEAEQADVLVLSQLALCGYPPRDLLTRDASYIAMKQAVQELAAAVADLRRV